MDKSAAPDRDTSCFLSNVGRNRAGARMAAKLCRPKTGARSALISPPSSSAWPIGMPLCRPLGDGLWEVRSRLPSRRIARLLFFVHERRIGVVHGFIKKTQKTPADDLDLARRRMKEMQA